MSIEAEGRGKIRSDSLTVLRGGERPEESKQVDGPIVNGGFGEEVVGFEGMQAGGVSEDVGENAEGDIFLTDQFEHLGIAALLDDDFKAMDDFLAEVAVGDFLFGADQIGKELDRGDAILFVLGEFFEDLSATETLQKDIETAIGETFFG